MAKMTDISTKEFERLNWLLTEDKFNLVTNAIVFK